MKENLIKIATLGLSKKQIKDIEDYLKIKSVKITYYDSLDDFISSQAKVLIVNSKVLNASEKEVFLNFYSGIYNKKDIIVCWLDYPVPPLQFRLRFHCHHYLDEIIYLLNNKFT